VPAKPPRLPTSEPTAELDESSAFTTIPFQQSFDAWPGTPKPSIAKR
jgi:hypothetical protein